MSAELQIKYNRGRQAFITNELVDMTIDQCALSFTLMSAPF